MKTQIYGKFGDCEIEIALNLWWHL